jgi:signal transduction histidine kinase
VMATTQALARGKQIQISQVLPQTLPTLYTDGQRVRQVILALLSNAVKYTEEGSIRLTVSVDAGSRPGQEITISVSDTGTGMSELERQALLTEGLYGSARADKSPPDGDGKQRPGFGLAISKRVVERLGGRIWVESEEGVGSTFTFTLPVRLDKAHPVGGAQPAGGVDPVTQDEPVAEGRIDYG